MGLTHSYTPDSVGTSIRSPHQRPSPNPKAMGVSKRKRHSLPAMTTFGHLHSHNLDGGLEVTAK